MKILQETTPDWDFPNHIYFVNDTKDKMFAYIKKATGELYEFGKPLPFSSSRRKFRKINNTWNFSPKEELELVGKTYRVLGSNGAIYLVNNNNGSWGCTCPASKWQKGECKHIKKLKAES